MTGYEGDEEVGLFRGREDEAQVPGVDSGVEVDTTYWESKFRIRRRPDGERGG